ncbi:hypothetical protein LINGRAHAP2_LOCUS25954 [Linum grandiflorum]
MDHQQCPISDSGS